MKNYTEEQKEWFLDNDFEANVGVSDWLYSDGDDVSFTVFGTDEGYDIETYVDIISTMGRKREDSEVSVKTFEELTDYFEDFMGDL